MKREWTSTQIAKLFQLDKKVKSRQTLLNCEERGEIPTASRKNRGTTQVRIWNTEQLPEIGKKFGFLQKPKKQIIIAVYTSKGGVLKSSFSHNLGRILALNGIMTMIIGFDIQMSITEMLLPSINLESLDDYNYEPLGLYHYLYHDYPLDKIISHTELPTLDFIPETTELNAVEKQLRHESRREYIIQDKLIPYLQDYDVIIFDNSPSWSCLIENALTAANQIISPIGCEINSYRALKQHLEFVDSFQSTMKLKWDAFNLIPTLLDKTKISQQIYGAYLNEYANTIPIPIRRSVKGHEAGVLGISAIEHDPVSTLASDYCELIKEVFNSSNNDKNIKVA